ELSSLSGLKQIKSFSMPDLSAVVVEFDLSKNIDDATDEVKSKLEGVIPFLPKEVERPIVQAFSFTDYPVLELIVSGDVPSSELYDYVEREMEDRLLQIDGVSKVDLEGGEIREIRLLADKRSMYEIQTNLTDLSAYLNLSNVKLSGGEFSQQHRAFKVEVEQQFKSVDDIRNTYVSTATGIRQVSDFAEVVDTVKNIQSAALFLDVTNQKKFNNIVSIGIFKKSKANEVKVTNAVKALLPELQAQLPEDVTISIPFDNSEYTQSAVDDALLNVILGILFTGIILFFFLNDIRTTLIVSITVPVSIIGTFMAIRLFDGSLNMMTLMSFSVAIGALISNSIVVIENIIRLRKTGMDIKKAAVQGTKEVMMAVIASTGTNLVVFLPIAAMTSITGAFFKEYALTISAATILSLIVSFMLTPLLTSILLKKDSKPSRLSRIMNRFFERLERAYESSLAKLISKKRYPILLFLSMLVVFIMSASLLSEIGIEMEPQEDTGNVSIQMEMPAGSTLEKTGEFLQLVEDKVSAHSEVNTMLSILGSLDGVSSGNNFANATLKLIPKEARAISNVTFAEMLAKELEAIPEIKANVSTTDADSGAPIAFALQSDDANELIVAHDLVMEKLSEIEGLLNYQSSYRKGSPVINLEPKKRELAALGLSAYDLAAIIRSSVNGIKASILKEKGKEYDITLSFAGNQVNSIEKIKQLPVFTPVGVYLVEQLMEVSYRNSQAQILHLDKEKTIEFAASPAPGIVTGDITGIIEQAISEMDLPSSVSFKWSGNIKELQETTKDMLITFAIALLLMYMLLASLLENVWQPILIFTTVPMAMIGVFLFMYFGGHTMNIMSIMAIVTLLGLVVNDDILIHDYTEQLKRQGMNKRDATLLAGKRKMKTVIMTTVAIIVGMLPNALGIGDAGAAYRTPMAIVTIGGMITSTILTLYLIPSLFYIFSKKEE
ncbi:MAG: efflux RND transporter permease subunit, partial [Bacteroidota bacterium]